MNASPEPTDEKERSAAHGSTSGHVYEASVKHAKANEDFPIRPFTLRIETFLERMVTATAWTLAYAFARLVNEWRERPGQAPKAYEKAKLHELLERVQFVPQAIIEGNVESLSTRLDVRLEEGVDDFDEYRGAGFVLNDTPVALMRYAGHPTNQYTLYLPYKIRETDEVTRMVSKIVSLLELSDQAVVWQRKDNPDL